MFPLLVIVLPARRIESTRSTPPPLVAVLPTLPPFAEITAPERMVGVPLPSASREIAPPPAPPPVPEAAPPPDPPCRWDRKLHHKWHRMKYPSSGIALLSHSLHHLTVPSTLSFHHLLQSCGAIFQPPLAPPSLPIPKGTASKKDA